MWQRARVGLTWRLHQHAEVAVQSTNPAETGGRDGKAKVPAGRQLASRKFQEIPASDLASRRKNPEVRRRQMKKVEPDCATWRDRAAVAKSPNRRCKEDSIASWRLCDTWQRARVGYDGVYSAIEMVTWRASFQDAQDCATWRILRLSLSRYGKDASQLRIAS